MARQLRFLFLGALWLFGAHLLAAAPEAPSPAVRLWEQGQDAMREGRIDVAMRCYQESLNLDPQLARNFLSLAAAHISRGDEAEATRWLAQYVAAQPDHHVIRLHYADLLLRQGKLVDGRAHLERFIADAQDRDDLAAAHLLDCHTKLVQIAEAGDDDYNEHLHRGIGLYLLACQRVPAPEEDKSLSSEALLCKSAVELGMAHLRLPSEARPCWYLHEVWSRLAQQHPAARWLRAAEAAVPFSYLTPAEKRSLSVACQRLELEGRHK